MENQVSTLLALKAFLVDGHGLSHLSVGVHVAVPWCVLDREGKVMTWAHSLGQSSKARLAWWMTLVGQII